MLRRAAFALVGLDRRLVPATGLEPVRCYSLEPESSASANSATRACYQSCYPPVSKAFAAYHKVIKARLAVPKEPSAAPTIKIYQDQPRSASGRFCLESPQTDPIGSPMSGSASGLALRCLFAGRLESLSLSLIHWKRVDRATWETFRVDSWQASGAIDFRSDRS